MNSKHARNAVATPHTNRRVESSRERPSFTELYLWGASRSQFLAVLRKAVSSVGSILTLAALSVYQFGLYQLILAALTIADSFTGGLFDDIVANDLARGLAEGRLAWAKRLFHEFLLSKVAVGLIAFGVLLVSADFVARYYRADIAAYLRLVSVIIVLSELRGAEMVFFQARVSFSAFGVGVMQEALKVCVVAAFWAFGSLGLREVLLATVFASLGVLCYTSFFFLREYRSLFGVITAERHWVLPSIVREHGRWVFSRYAFSRAVKNTDVWFVRIFLNTEAVAFYALATNLITSAQSLIPVAMLKVLLPWEVERKARFEYIYRRTVKYGIWIGTAMAVGGFIFVPSLIELFFPKYLPAMPVFRFMLLSLPLYGVYKLQKAFLIVLREQRMLAFRVFTEATVMVLILGLFLPLIGLPAAAIAYLAAYGGRVVLYAIYLRRKYPGLKFKMRQLLMVDGADWQLATQAIRIFFKPSRWMKPIRYAHGP